MKLLCAGDLHLGASPDLGASPHGEGSRLDDQRSVWHRIVKLAASEQVDGVLWAGDAFHRRRPTPSELQAWRDGIEFLHDEGIPLVGIAGNHDVEAYDRIAAPEVVGGGGYHMARRPGVNYAIPGVAVAELPWTPPAHLISTLDGQVDRDEVNERLAEHLVDVARGLREEIDDERAAILLLHWSISGASLPNGLPVEMLREPVLPLSALEDLGFQMIVAGHIHAPLLWGHGPECKSALYCGSPMVCDWGETGVEHGVWILDTEPYEVPRFVPIEDRRFATVDVDLTLSEGRADGSRASGPPAVGEGGTVPANGDTGRLVAPSESALDATDTIVAALAEHFPLTDAVVRIRYRATSEQARRVDAAAIRGVCDDAGVHKLYAIQPEIVRTDRVRVEGVDETLAPLEALHEWVKANELTHEQDEQLGELTARYLQDAAA